MENIYGVEYNKPKVILMQDTGIGTAEFAGRTAYDSFENSENWCVRELNEFIGGDEDRYELPIEHTKEDVQEQLLKEVNEIDNSKLLDDLAWTYFHHSVLEHANLTFLIKGTSRGTLQELARHRIASYTVRSTRYTMSSIINAFVASTLIQDEDSRFKFLFMKIEKLDMFVTNGNYNTTEVNSIMNKLDFQLKSLGKEDFMKTALSKNNLEYFRHCSEEDNPENVLNNLENGKKKRNVGDAFKHVVSDNWKVDLVMTMNLRSLKNFFTLRDSGAAFFQIQWLAQEMKKVTPKKYLDLIIK